VKRWVVTLHGIKGYVAADENGRVVRKCTTPELLKYFQGGMVSVMLWSYAQAGHLKGWYEVT
jgi:hypothetical protein